MQDGRVHFSTFNGYCSTYYPLLHASLAAYMQVRSLPPPGCCVIHLVSRDDASVPLDLFVHHTFRISISHILPRSSFLQ